MRAKRNTALEYIYIYVCIGQIRIFFHFFIVIVERYRGTRYRFDIEVAHETRGCAETGSCHRNGNMYIVRRLTDFQITFSLIFTVSCVYYFDVVTRRSLSLYLFTLLFFSLSLSLFFARFIFSLQFFAFFSFSVFFSYLTYFSSGEFRR